MTNEEARRIDQEAFRRLERIRKAYKAAETRAHNTAHKAKQEILRHFRGIDDVDRAARENALKRIEIVQEAAMESARAKRDNGLEELRRFAGERAELIIPPMYRKNKPSRLASHRKTSGKASLHRRRNASGLAWSYQDERDHFIYIAHHDFGIHGTGGVTYVVRPEITHTRGGPRAQGYSVEVLDLAGKRKGWLANYKGHLGTAPRLFPDQTMAKTAAEAHSGAPGRASSPRRRRNGDTPSPPSSRSFRRSRRGNVMRSHGKYIDEETVFVRKARGTQGVFRYSFTTRMGHPLAVAHVAGGQARLYLAGPHGADSALEAFAAGWLEGHGIPVLGAPQRGRHNPSTAKPRVVVWSKVTPYMASSPILVGQIPGSEPFVEVSEGMGARYIIDKVIDDGSGYRVLKSVTTNTWTSGPTDRGRALGFPGAGYAMEIGERMLLGSKRQRGLRRKTNPHMMVRDLPEGIQRLLREVGYGRKDIRVESNTVYSPAAPSGEGLKSFTGVVDLGTGRYKIEWGSWGGANIFTQRQVDLDTNLYPLPYNGAVVQGHIGGGRPVYADVVVHPENLQKLLPAGPAEDLSEAERTALLIIKSYKASYRSDGFSRHDLGPYNEHNPVIRRLAQAGLVKVTGTGIQITMAGKNVAETIKGIYV